MPPPPRRSRIGLLFSVLLTVVVVGFNVRLYTRNPWSGEELAREVEPQLRFVRGQLDDGSASRMQRLFPEGYFFNHVLHGLAWIDLARGQPDGSPLRAQALAEAREALQAIDSDEGRAPFNPSLKPAWGIFYAGWSAWLRGAILSQERPPDAAAAERLEAECRAIAKAFDDDETPFLESYPLESWPSDSVVAAAALRLHDTILPPRYTATITRFVEHARARLDPATGLLPHYISRSPRGTHDGARGSSQSVIQRFLVEVDPAFAREQYLRFREHFLVTRLGVPGVREFPAAREGSGDVDSGPLLWGVSASATVLTIGAARVHGDTTTADALAGAAEAFGVPIHLGAAKYYAFGLLPVGDAFIAWSKAARPYTTTPDALGAPQRVISRAWRLPMHALGALLLVLVWWRRRRRAK